MPPVHSLDTSFTFGLVSTQHSGATRARLAGIHRARKNTGVTVFDAKGLQQGRAHAPHLRRLVQRRRHRSLRRGLPHRAIAVVAANLAPRCVLAEGTRGRGRARAPIGLWYRGLLLHLGRRRGREYEVVEALPDVKRDPLRLVLRPLSHELWGGGGGRCDREGWVRYHLRVGLAWRLAVSHPMARDTTRS